MIIKNDNALMFATGSKRGGFTFENKDRVVGSFSLANGRTVLLSVSNHDGQMHLNAHLPQVVPGKAAFRLYTDLAENEKAFGTWVDPSDGECQFIIHLADETEEELDRAVDELDESVCAIWGKLDEFAEIAKEQSEEDEKAYDLTDIVFSSLLG